MVRLGITAPKRIPVHRKEVYEAIQRENQAASEMRLGDLPTSPNEDRIDEAGDGQATAE